MVIAQHDELDEAPEGEELVAQFHEFIEGISPEDLRSDAAGPRRASPSSKLGPRAHRLVSARNHLRLLRGRPRRATLV